jgi:hypothetical protein
MVDGLLARLFDGVGLDHEMLVDREQVLALDQDVALGRQSDDAAEHEPDTSVPRSHISHQPRS